MNEKWRSEQSFLWMKRNNKYVVNGEKENVNIGIFIWRPHSSVATVGITHLFYGFYRLSLRCICSYNIIPAMWNVNLFSIIICCFVSLDIVFKMIIIVVAIWSNSMRFRLFKKWDTNFIDNHHKQTFLLYRTKKKHLRFTESRVAWWCGEYGIEKRDEENEQHEKPLESGATF